MQNAGDPSQLVDRNLQNHVHLISAYRYPELANLSIEQALRYLIDAPTIVKANAPMAWQYVQTPADGTVWLEWTSMRNNAQQRFPSDGYVWAGPEQAVQREVGGYTVEWITHAVGYRPGQEHTASHARTRFHFISKNPSVNAAPPDPSLWIVHYHRAEPNRMMAVAQIPVSSHARQQLSERRWLEMQGRLERKEFMLHDRDHWPTITIPTNGAPPVPQQQPMQQQAMHMNPALAAQSGIHRFPQPQMHQGQGPPATRARHSGPNTLPGPADAAQVHDSTIEEDENQFLDYFDHLTPRDISMTRYTQHHRWMEEVFNSPYASSAIVPPDLGLGLMGELKGLTDGILNPPSINDVKDIESRPHAAKEALPFTNLKDEQISEFNRRVEKHLEEGQAEIERMKQEHAERMTEWKKSKGLLQAEKRLRYATWEGHESALPAAFKLEVAQTNGHSEEGAAPETVEEVVKDVEKLLGVKIEAHNDATMVKRGGLEEEEEKVQGVTDTEMGADEDAAAQDLATDLSNHAPSDAPQNAVPPLANPEMPQLGQMPEASGNPLPSQLDPAPLDPQQSGLDMLQDPFVTDDTGAQPDFGDVGDLEMADMDMDMDTGDIDFVQHDEDEFGNTPMTTGAGETGEAAPAAPSEAPASTAQVEAEPPAAPLSTLEPPEQQERLELAPSAEESAIPALAADASLGNEPDVSALSEPQPPVTAVPEPPAMPEPKQDDADIFGDGTFDDLPDVGGEEDNGGGDDDGGLVDFDAGMDTAFDDAVQGVGDEGVTLDVAETVGGEQREHEGVE